MCKDDCGSATPSRRQLLQGAAGAAVGLAYGKAVAQTPAAPAQPPPVTRVLDTPSVIHGPVDLPHNGEKRIGGYLARPREPGVYRAVLVVAGNRISEEYIPNTCAALALAGFVGLAPDLFHTLPDLSRHTETDGLDDIQTGASFLRNQPYVAGGGMGIVGFCFGGKMALLFAARSRDIDAVVAYHPGVLAPERLKRLRQPVTIHQGTGDTSVPADNARRLEQALKAQGNDAKLYLYPGAEHGFLAYTRPFYRPDHAQLSWERTIRFLREHVRAAD